MRLHPHHTERVLARSPFLSELMRVAGAHHERLDGSGYHRGSAGAELSLPARLIAAADAYHAMTEPRPHRQPRSPEQAAAELAREASTGRFDPDAVAAVVEVAGQPVPRIERPAGLTEREAEVVGMLARGLQTKQVARALGISIKTADRHIQNAYGKIGVSTRGGRDPVCDGARPHRVGRTPDCAPGGSLLTSSLGRTTGAGTPTVRRSNDGGRDAGR